MAEAASEAMLETMAELLAVLRDTRSASLVTATERAKVLNEYLKLTGWKSTQGPKPVTLERSNMLPEGVDSFSVREDGPAGPYTVTDKADGSRFMLFINSQGKGYLIDDRRNVLPDERRQPRDGWVHVRQPRLHGPRRSPGEHHSFPAREQSRSRPAPGRRQRGRPWAKMKRVWKASARGLLET